MGYKRPARVFKLTFEDPEMDGLVVRVRSVKLGKLLGLVRAMDLDTEKLTPDNTDLIDDVFKTFAEALVSWNLEDEKDQPVPTTVEGVYDQELDFVMAIVDAWVNALTGVSTPLAKSSTGGGNFLEASLPMEVLPSNLPS